MQYQPGDILLYSDQHDIVADIIQRATHGKCNHAAIVVDASHCVEALAQGIRKDGIATPYAIGRTSGHLNHLDAGLAWLTAQVGDGYGWLDIAEDGYKVFDPDTAIGATCMPHSYDCSHLALAFLLRAGFQVPPSFAALVQDPATCSPNDLYRMFQALSLLTLV
jgi:uncharacterized protein YycO